MSLRRTLLGLVSWPIGLLAVSQLAVAAPGQAAEGAELIGTPAEPWRAAHWIHSEPLRLEDLRGRVVLVRFWTAPGCRFCSASAPALNELHARYAGRGLTVVGMYHHKARSPLDPADVARYADRFGFRFPIAIDLEWRTLRKWWLTPGAGRAYTSVSFLIDRRGVIRHIHRGGKYERGDADYAALTEMIERLCDER